jgi:hypothetical protein
MVIYGFEIDDVAAIRFAVSAIHEPVNSVRTFAIGQPQRCTFPGYARSVAGSTVRRYDR